VAASERTLIFTRNSSGRLVQILAQLNAKPLRGLASSRKRIMHEYKHGELKTVFVETVDDIAGMQFENTSDIILLYKPNDVELTQIIGRGVRINRRPNFPLKVHFVLAA
jgi:hypothetical protein